MLFYHESYDYSLSLVQRCLSVVFSMFMFGPVWISKACIHDLITTGVMQVQKRSAETVVLVCLPIRLRLMASLPDYMDWAGIISCDNSAAILGLWLY